MTWQMDLSWQADALCVSRNTDDFYTHSDDRSGDRKRHEYLMRKELKEFCAECPVQDACPSPCLAV